VLRSKCQRTQGVDTANSLTQTHTHAFSLTLSHILSHPHSHTHTHMSTHSFSLSLSISLYFPPSLPLCRTRKQVLTAEDPTNLCIDKSAREGRESFIAVLIPLPDNIMTYMNVSPSLAPSFLCKHMRVRCACRRVYTHHLHYIRCTDILVR